MTFTKVLMQSALAVAVGVSAAGEAKALSAAQLHAREVAQQTGVPGRGGNAGAGRTTPHVGPTSGQNQFLVPFECNRITGEASSSATFINAAGVSAPILNLQVFDDRPSSAGASFVSYVNFAKVEFDFMGDTGACIGPFVLVTNVGPTGGDEGIYGANVMDGEFSQSKFANAGFTHVTITADDLGLPNNRIGDLDIELFPDTIADHNAQIVNVAVNGHVLTRNPKTLFNFCPLGFEDPRPIDGCGL